MTPTTPGPYPRPHRLANDPPHPGGDARTRLMDAAEGLMIGQGYVASSVDSICRDAGLTKGSFFHHFKNKEELGVALLERFVSRQGDVLRATCSDLEDPLERVLCLVDMTIEGAVHEEMRGCLVGTFAQEISESHPNLREVCGECFANAASSVADDLAAAKALHCPDADFDAASLGAYFLSLAQGSMLVRRATGDGEAMARSLRLFRAYLTGLFGR